jgi:hypothetical protein
MTASPGFSPQPASSEPIHDNYHLDFIFATDQCSRRNTDHSTSQVSTIAVMAEVITTVADVLSIITSVTEITTNLINLCVDYYATVRESPKDIGKIREKAVSYKSDLEILQMVLSKRQRDKLDCRELLEGITELIRTSATVIEELLPLLGTPDSRRTFCKLSLPDLAWSSKENDVKRLLEKLESIREAINRKLMTFITSVSKTLGLHHGLS